MIALLDFVVANVCRRLLERTARRVDPHTAHPIDLMIRARWLDGTGVRR